MPAHGDHWQALYGNDADLEAVIRRDCEQSVLVDHFECVDVANGTERAEEVACLRWGKGQLVEDMLIVTDSVQQEQFLFSGYPVVTDGMLHKVQVAKVEPWEYGIEGWLHVLVGENKVPVSFFDTRYYAGSAQLAVGEQVEVRLAGLAYSIRPMQQRTIEVEEGPLWEMQKNRRLEEGMTPEDASAPVVIHLSGMAVFLPREGEDCDDAEFAGVVDAIEHFDHAGIAMVKLDVVVMRMGDEAFTLPIFVSEYVLNGFKPRVGDDIQGLMWVQGQVECEISTAPRDAVIAPTDQ
mgnify:CR=1 FL=1